MSITTRPEERSKIGWYAKHVESCNSISKEKAEVVLLGDSLVANLAHYPVVWEHLSKLKAVNCGIGGDGTQNVLWRVEKMFLPAKVSVCLIHCGVNDIHRTSDKDFCPDKI